MDTVTVVVWAGSPNELYEDIVGREPDRYEMDVVGKDTYYVPHEDHVQLADYIEHHGKYAFTVETEEMPVILTIETNDSYHSPVDGFDNGRPIEGGLLFAPEGHPSHNEEPFQCEMWGRIRMRVEEVI